MNRQDRQELEKMLNETAGAMLHNAMRVVEQSEIVLKRDTEQHTQDRQLIQKEIQTLKREQLAFHKIQIEAIRRGTIVGIIRGWLKL